MEKIESILKGTVPSPTSSKSYKDQDADLRTHADAVSKLPDTARSLIASQPKESLQGLSPSQHTISYAYVLDVLLDPTHFDSVNDRAWLQLAVEQFLSGFDWIHIRFIGGALTSILQRLSCNGLFSPQRTIELLTSTILRVDPSGSVFTSSHLLLANFALTIGASEASVALQVFEKDIIAYPPNTSLRAGRPLSDPSLSPTVYISPFTKLTETVKASMVLDYGMILGQIYISRKDWPRARAALEQVVTHPTKDKGVVKMMIAAYKKWVLLSILESGRSSALPSYTSSTAKSNYSNLAPYNSLGAAFESGPGPEQLQNELTQHAAIYEEDGNSALVREVVQAYQKWQVVNLRLAYTRISISRIREETFSGETGQRLPSTEAMDALLREMIDSGMLKARFELDEHGNETYLAFQDETLPLSEVEFAKKIAWRHRLIKDLTAQYKVANERLSGNKEYAKYVYREQRKQADEAAQNAGFDDSLEDEDLMSGVVRAS